MIKTTCRSSSSITTPFVTTNTDTTTVLTPSSSTPPPPSSTVTSGKGNILSLYQQSRQESDCNYQTTVRSCAAEANNPSPIVRLQIPASLQPIGVIRHQSNCNSLRCFSLYGSFFSNSEPLTHISHPSSFSQYDNRFKLIDVQQQNCTNFEFNHTNFHTIQQQQQKYQLQSQQKSKHKISQYDVADKKAPNIIEVNKSKTSNICSPAFNTATISVEGVTSSTEVAKFKKPSGKKNKKKKKTLSGDSCGVESLLDTQQRTNECFNFKRDNNSTSVIEIIKDNQTFNEHICSESNVLISSQNKQNIATTQIFSNTTTESSQRQSTTVEQIVKILPKNKASSLPNSSDWSDSTATSLNKLATTPSPSAAEATLPAFGCVNKFMQHSHVAPKFYCSVLRSCSATDVNTGKQEETVKVYKNNHIAELDDTGNVCSNNNRNNNDDDSNNHRLDCVASNRTITCKTIPELTVVTKTNKIQTITNTSNSNNFSRTLPSNQFTSTNNTPAFIRDNNQIPQMIKLQGLQAQQQQQQQASIKIPIENCLIDTFSVDNKQSSLRNKDISLDSQVKSSSKLPFNCSSLSLSKVRPKLSPRSITNLSVSRAPRRLNGSASTRSESMSCTNRIMPSSCCIDLESETNNSANVELTSSTTVNDKTLDTTKTACRDDTVDTVVMSQFENVLEPIANYSNQLRTEPSTMPCSDSCLSVKDNVMDTLDTSLLIASLQQCSIGCENKSNQSTPTLQSYGSTATTPASSNSATPPPMFLFSRSSDSVIYPESECGSSENGTEYDPLSRWIDLRLTQTLFSAYHRFKQTPMILEQKRQLQRNITDCLAASFGISRPFKLFMTGSSATSLGTYNSDMDLCMIFYDARNGKIDGRYTHRFEASNVLQEILSVLSGNGLAFNAKVIHSNPPILKFIDKHGFEVNLNINRSVTIQNTLLLQKVCALDSRIRPFLFTTKLWALKNGINCAYLKSLSSYSISLMSIFVLQNVCGIVPKNLEPIIAEVNKISDYLIHGCQNRDENSEILQNEWLRLAEQNVDLLEVTSSIEYFLSPTLYEPQNPNIEGILMCQPACMGDACHLKSQLQAYLSYLRQSFEQVKQLGGGLQLTSLFLCAGFYTTAYDSIRERSQSIKIWKDKTKILIRKIESKIRSLDQIILQYQCVPMHNDLSSSGIVQQAMPIILPIIPSNNDLNMSNDELIESCSEDYNQEFQQSSSPTLQSVLVNQQPTKETQPIHYQSLGALFNEFMIYYSTPNVFDNVLCVRTGEPETRYCQRFSCSPDSAMITHICVEEPFSVTNTTHSVHHDYMFSFILRAFKDTRKDIREMRFNMDRYLL